MDRTYFSLPLPPRPTVRRGCSTAQVPSGGILASLRMAASMVNPGADLLRVHEDKFLALIVPFILQFFLADGTYSTGLGWVGDDDVLVFRIGVVRGRVWVGRGG